MPEVIIKAEIGKPQAKLEGGKVVVTKPLLHARIVETSQALRVRGKQADPLKLHTAAELQTSMKADRLKQKIIAEHLVELKKLKQKVSHLTGRLIAAKEDGKANTKAWERMRDESRAAKRELAKLLQDISIIGK